MVSSVDVRFVTCFQPNLLSMWSDYWWHDTHECQQNKSLRRYMILNPIHKHWSSNIITLAKFMSARPPSTTVTVLTLGWTLRQSRQIQ